MSARSRVARSLIVMLAACVLLIGWIAYRVASNTGAAFAASDRTPTRATTGAEVDIATNADALPALDTQLVRLEARGDDHAASTAPRALEYDRNRELLVRVVNDDTGAPIPHALVRVWPSIERDWMQFWYEYAAVSDLFERSGSQRFDVQADEHGRAVIKRSKSGQFLGARSADSSGFASAPLVTEAECEIRCVPDAALEIRVTDERGAAVADAWVSLRDRDDAYSSPYWIARTDGDGRCALQHARAVLRRYPDEALAIGLACPGTELVEQRIDSRALPEQPIVLRMPALGRLSIQWVDELGKPLDIRGSIDIGYEDDEYRSRANLAVLREAGYGSFSVEHGKLELACAATGRMLTLSSYPLDGWGDVDEQHTPTLRLPSRPLERAELRIPLRRVRREIRARIVGPDGAPCANAEFSLHWLDDAPSSGLAPSAHDRSDARGGIAIEVGSDAVQRALLLRTETDAGAWLEARIDAAPLEPGATRDVGDVALRPAALLVAGRVVDADGRAVPYAALRLESFSAQQFVARVAGNYDGHTLYSTHADEHGLFRIPGASPEFARYVGAPLQLDARPPHGLIVRNDVLMLDAEPPSTRAELGRASASVACGATELELVLQREAHLRGRIEIPPGYRMRDFSIQAESRARASDGAPNGAQALQRRGTRIEPETSKTPGVFDFGPLPDGVWTVRLRDAHYAFEIATVADVWVGPNAAQDPRLDPLRVPSTWRRLRVDLVDASGQAVMDGHVAVLDRARGADGWSRIANGEFEPGSFHVWTERVPIDLEAWAEGAAPARALAVDADTRIVLRDGIPFEVRPSAVQAGSRVRVQLEWIDPDPLGENADDAEREARAMRQSPWPTSYDGEAGGIAPGPFVLYPPCAGRWRLSAYVERDDDWVSLHDAGGAQSWDVDVSAAGGSYDLQASVPPPPKSE